MVIAYHSIEGRRPLEMISLILLTSSQAPELRMAALFTLLLGRCMTIEHKLH